MIQRGTKGALVISNFEFDAFVIMAILFAIWAGDQLVEIRRELKALREKFLQ